MMATMLLKPGQYLFTKGVVCGFVGCIGHRAASLPVRSLLAKIPRTDSQDNEI
jgi:hypothetical protein